MKKGLAVVLSVSMLSASMVAMTGCSKSNSPSKNEQEAGKETNAAQEKQLFTYSLMSDEKTKDEINQLMLENNIPAENVRAFFRSLNQFNELMGEMKGSTDGFKEVSDSSNLFDYDYIGTTWMKNVKFDDQQCRLTAFNLLKDVISIPSEAVVEDPNHALSGDLEIEKTNPNVALTDEELDKYKNLYVDVEVDGKLGAQAVADAIKADWAKRGITFESGVKASLMSVFFTSAQTGTAFVGHAGVVLETQEGYVLVEKLAQYAPYVASKFDDMDEMKSYLAGTYGAFIEEGMPEPLIFINDQWLK